MNLPVDEYYTYENHNGQIHKASISLNLHRVGFKIGRTLILLCKYNTVQGWRTLGGQLLSGTVRT